MDQKHPYHNAICRIERRVDTRLLRRDCERAPCGAIHAHRVKRRIDAFNYTLENPRFHCVIPRMCNSEQPAQPAPWHNSESHLSLHRDGARTNSATLDTELMANAI